MRNEILILYSVVLIIAVSMLSLKADPRATAIKKPSVSFCVIFTSTSIRWRLLESHLHATLQAQYGLAGNVQELFIDLSQSHS